MSRDLELLWNKLALRLPVMGESNLLREKLFRHYEEPHRAYHKLEHLRFCFGELDMLRSEGEVSAAFELALWFHDVIYDPRSNENEEQSALFFRNETRPFGWDRTLLDEVSRLIMVTKSHQPGDDFESRLISDIDLAILGQGPDDFFIYETRIRSEYSWVEESVYRRGRAEALKRFLNRPSVYFTAFFKTRYEESARSNLQNSLIQLASSAPS